MRLLRPQFAAAAALLLVVRASASAQSGAPSERQLLEAEHARGDAALLIAGTRSADPRLQRIAVRALGRFERADLQPAIQPLVRAADARVRAEAVNALGQMNAPFDYASLLTSERDPVVRGVIYETIGRVRMAPADAEGTLARGLAEPTLPARAGASRM